MRDVPADAPTGQDVRGSLCAHSCRHPRCLSSLTRCSHPLQPPAAATRRSHPPQPQPQQPPAAATATATTRRIHSHSNHPPHPQPQQPPAASTSGSHSSHLAAGCCGGCCTCFQTFSRVFFDQLCAHALCRVHAHAHHAHPRYTPPRYTHLHPSNHLDALTETGHTEEREEYRRRLDELRRLEVAPLSGPGVRGQGLGFRVLGIGFPPASLSPSPALPVSLWLTRPLGLGLTLAILPPRHPPYP